MFVCWLAWGFACVLTRSVRLVTVARQTPKLLHLVINISASDWPDAVWDGHFVGLVTPSSIKGGEGLWVASRMQVKALFQTLLTVNTAPQRRFVFPHNNMIHVIKRCLWWMMNELKDLKIMLCCPLSGSCEESLDVCCSWGGGGVERTD